jgi:hypothetical protein
VQRNKRAATLSPHHDVLGCQLIDRMAQGTNRDAQGLGELPFAGQDVARRVAAGLDGGDQLPLGLSIKWSRGVLAPDVPNQQSLSHINELVDMLDARFIMTLIRTLRKMWR